MIPDMLIGVPQLPTATALGTNKLPAIAGTGSAITYARRGGLLRRDDWAGDRHLPRANHDRHGRADFLHGSAVAKIVNAGFVRVVLLVVVCALVARDQFFA